MGNAISAPPRQRIVVAAPDTDGSLTEPLEQSGFSVTRSRNVDELWAGLGDGETVVLCDSRLPGLNPRQLIRDVKDRFGDGGVYVVMVGEHAEFEPAMSAGVDDFLALPIEGRSVMRRMRVADRMRRVQLDLSRKTHVLEQTNRRILGELRSAAQVQQALLPPRDFTAPGFEAAWNLRPCDELAGDLLNCIRLDERHLAFWVLDVSGHGVSSALLSVQVSRMMTPILSESQILKHRLPEPPWYRIAEPHEVICQLNRVFCGGSGSQYFTILYGLAEMGTGRVRFSSAGHPGPIHVPAGGEPQVVGCRGLPVGLFPDTSPDQHELTLGQGDRLWLFSDGVTEAMDANERQLGAEGLAELVRSRGSGALQTSVDAVMQQVETWPHPQQPDDDCSLLLIARQ